MAIVAVMEFNKFRDLLKRRYGVTPADVGVDGSWEYWLAYSRSKPSEVVERLALKYDLVRISCK